MESKTNRIDYIKTEKRLENALIALLYANPIDKISINDIVSEAGLSRGTFYLHYNA